MGNIIRRNVALEQEDVREVEHLRRSKGLGIRGFSAALRMIIREWAESCADDRVRITEAGREALRKEDGS